MRAAAPCCRLVLSLVFVGWLAGVSVAQQRLEAVSGQVYDGQVLSDDGTTVEFKTTRGATLKLPYERLKATSQYRLILARTGDDVDAQMDLADWCVDKVLYKEARRHYDRALDAAGDERADDVNARLDAARTKAGEELLARAKNLQATNKPNEAREVLTTILKELPLEEVAEEAAVMLQEDSGRQKRSMIGQDVADAADADESGQADADDDVADADEGADSSNDGSAADRPVVGGRRPEDPNADVDPRSGRHAVRANGKFYTKRARKIMAPVVQHYYNMIDWTVAALVHPARKNAIELLQGVVLERKKMLTTLDSLRAQGETNEEIAEAIALAERKTEEATADAIGHLADMYMNQGSFDEAVAVVEDGVANYPRNEHLLRTQDRVGHATSSGGRWVILGERRKQ